ncbi:competence type IV pilus ATPase ComGA [Lysinibacillus sp. FSL M8-0216]|uniref:Competence-related pilin export protein ComGA (TC 3.A.14.1.1) n=1 Tax=Lysinibacillus fusiformis TaxID=28031 RepID=A0A1H9IE88_9BACI|nr:competence type IV pilus ATPase ComGA [Lysinibacillus fusiformis]EAZ83688.1 DNA transport machinary [Bacillus sp. B14905]HAU35117.1 competence protein ComG [Lysinibacillus sp.]MED4078948.1 competence type IV pilus ATPase ComGA [Lysinibacillus fusiformis]NOG28808.1 Flp pilus assembly complex ATPase component TadA [Lysinibacillus fusiformis]SCX56395.1 competence-related pilin export protein ComGA (TC 3.A.14.1.1) [Lysinibacillus fusiformis]
MQNFEIVVEQKCEQLLLKAYHFGATDLLLVPSNINYRIYFRKYDKLLHAGELPNDLAERMISYYKFLAQLDISERRKPQSGSFQKAMEQQSYAFRVSTLPSVFLKESLIIRLLLQNHSFPLTSLCFFKSSAYKLMELVQNRQGLLFFTGATGSGKSTSLYSLIHYCSTELNRHVISLEDPVENNQANLLQIQVNERAGVTYATGLKAILRHSPDVIMIGEIRDKETAKIAIEASLTGHLVVSTIHAKDSISCLYRLMDLGVSIDELQQTIIGIVAQVLFHSSALQDDRRALYEILSDIHLNQAITAILNKGNFQLPYELTIKGQKELVESHYAVTNIHR